MNARRRSSRQVAAFPFAGLPALLVAVSTPAFGVAPDASAPATWTGALSGFYYALPDQPDFGVAVATLDRGPLHLEARYNYEARAATSIFAGWTLAGGETVTWELTPILGGLFGSTRGVVPGVEASVAWKELDFYVEAEYVRDLDDSGASYAYAWSELGWTPVSWLRFGLAGQRTRLVENDRDVQHGAFVQLRAGKATLGAYAFNPESGRRYAIVSLSLQF